MKRGAEKQLSKDDHSDGEVQDDNPQVGFRKADESVLATRKIRGLPKRASVAAIPPPAEAPSANFGGFSGFNGTSSSFSGFATTTTTAPTNFFTPTTAAQTNTARSLTSLLSSRPAATNTSSTPSSTSASPSSSPFATPPAAASVFAPVPASTAPQLDSTKKDDTIDPAELKYYTSLRGLNESLRAAVIKAVDDDAFADISVFLERYKSLRADIQKEFDGKASPLPSSSSMAPASSAPVVKTFSMPAPPIGGFTFGGMKPSTSTDAKPSTTATPSTGFVPTFGVKPQTDGKSDTPTSLPFSLGTKPTETTMSSSFFGTKQPETSKDTTPASSTLAPSPLPVPTPPKQSDSIKSETIKPSVFGGTSSSHAFTFGSGSLPSFTMTSSTKPTDATASAPTASSRFAGFTGFGTTSATTSTSLGFKSSFATTTTTPAPALGLASTPSTLTATASDTSTGGANGDTAAGGGDEEPKKNIAESFLLNADNKHDQEGAGEEDEETMHAVKLKAYVMKDDKGGKSWVELGYGVLRIKKHKETEKRRVLLRSSSTGQILINFNFHSAFKPAQKGKNVTFLGHDTEGASKMYTLKLQTQDQATALAATFEREIQANEASSS